MKHLKNYITLEHSNLWILMFGDRCKFASCHSQFASEKCGITKFYHVYLVPDINLNIKAELKLIMSAFVVFRNINTVRM